LLKDKEFFKVYKLSPVVEIVKILELKTKATTWGHLRASARI